MISFLIYYDFIHISNYCILLRLNISNNNGDQTIFFKDATRKIISEKEWLKIEDEYPEYFI